MSSWAVTVSPVVVLVAPIRLMIVSWLVRGLPRQFLVIWENRRCSILFHLLVPGGRMRRLQIAKPGPIELVDRGVPGLEGRLWRPRRRSAATNTARSSPARRTHDQTPSRTAYTADGTPVEVNEMTADAGSYVFRYEFAAAGRPTTHATALEAWRRR